MAYTLPNGDITFSSGEKLASAKMNDFSGNQSDMAKEFSKIHTKVNGLSTVAETGSYNDLLDRPTIPTPGAGKLTIQVGGVDVATFGANQTNDTVANITIPGVTLEQSTGESTSTAMSQNAVTDALNEKQNKLTDTQQKVIDLTVTQEEINQITTNKDAIDALQDTVSQLTGGTTDITAELNQIKQSISELEDEKASRGTTLADYGIKNAYTMDEINAKLSSAMTYKGQVPTYEDLPSNDDVQPGEEPRVKIGDVYNVEKGGHNYAWNGEDWDDLMGVVDLSDYYTKSETYSKKEVQDYVSGIVGEDVPDMNDYYTKDEVDAKLKDVDVDLTDYYKKSETYSQTEVNDKIAAAKPDMTKYYTKDDVYAKSETYGKSDVYTKTEVDNLLDDVEVDLSDYYTKSETYGRGDLYTKTEVNNAINAAKPDMDQYYTKSEVYAKSETYGKSDLYTKTEVTNAINAAKPDLTQYYTKTETYGKSDLYTKTEVDSKINAAKPDMSNYYTKTEVLNLIKSEIAKIAEMDGTTLVITTKES